MRLVPILLACVLLAGCSPRPSVIVKQGQVPAAGTLYSLDPEHGSGDADPTTDFHGFRALGSVPLTDVQIERVTTALDDAIAAHDGVVAGCFNPRHGVRLQTADGTPTEYVICFECRSMYVFDALGARSSVNIADQPDVLNAMLDDAGVARHERW